LIERLFCFENFCIEKFDRDFNRFLSKTIFVNYEISKIFLEKERENAEKLQGIIQIKDEEILNFKTKISMLEQVSFKLKCFKICKESYRKQKYVKKDAA